MTTQFFLQLINLCLNATDIVDRYQMWLIFTKLQYDCVGRL